MKKHYINLIKRKLSVFIILIALFTSVINIFNPLYSQAASTAEEYLYTTKWQAPKSTDKTNLYTAFATRVTNMGRLSKLEIYYVLTEDSNLTVHIMDCDLNIITSSSAVYTKAGVGMQTFSIPAYSYSAENMYVCLKSDKQSIAIGTVQESGCANASITSDNAVAGIENAQQIKTTDPLYKVHGQVRAGIALYFKAYGYRGDFSTATNNGGSAKSMSINSTTKTVVNGGGTSKKTVFISTSTGRDVPSAGSSTSPYYSLSYALNQNGSNTTYKLKSGESYFEPKGVSLINKKNVDITSYGTGRKPEIIGLKPISFTKSGDMYTATLSDPDIGTLLINGTHLWGRQTLSSSVTKANNYYYDRNTCKLTLKYSGTITSAAYSVPYVGLNIENCSNLVIDGLRITDYGRIGIRVNYYSSNIKIVNNGIYNIGGTIITDGKYGNGVELWLTGLTNITVAYNEVYNCFDAGLTAQIKSTSDGAGYTNSNIDFSNNTVASCRYCFEYFNSLSNTTCTLKFHNNTLCHSCDISNGMREENQTGYGGFLCLWRTNGATDKIEVNGNTCYDSDANAVALPNDSQGKIVLNYNKFSNYVNKFAYPNYIYGTGNVFN